MQSETTNILVIAPHADDAEFGVGGYLHRMVREGTQVPTVGIIAGGDYVGRHGDIVRGDQRVEETRLAMAMLGVRDHVTLGNVRENEFDIVGRKVLIDQIDLLLARKAFDEVFVCLPGFNQDHTALYEAAIAALRPGRWGVKRLWAYPYPGTVDEPTMGRCYLCLADSDMKAKSRSLHAHYSQFGSKVQNHIGPNGAWRLAALRGSECGALYAETVYLIREIY